MATRAFAELTITASLVIFCFSYIWLSRREGSYLNILTPSLIIEVPANYILPLFFIGFTGKLFGSEYSAYAYTYVYATLATENVAFVAAYLWTRNRVIRLPFTFSYRNFASVSVICLCLAMASYLLVLIEFRQYVFDPRQIYIRTHTGYGLETYSSTFLSLMAVVFILFARRHWVQKSAVIIIAAGLLWLRGSKTVLLTVIFFLLLYQAYVLGRRFTLLRALFLSVVVAAVTVGLFALTMPLGDSVTSAVERISSYSDYTRNAMLVIDSRMEPLGGRLTLEANTYGLIPRAIMPNKPKDFGAFYLAKKFYPDWFYADTGAPAFGIGLQYADFGPFAVVYLLFFSLLRGWLGRIFVNRLWLTKHPADFVVVAFLAGASVIPIGGVGWLFPEILAIAFLMRYLSRIGAHPDAGRSMVGELSPAQ